MKKLTKTIIIFAVIFLAVFSVVSFAIYRNYKKSITTANFESSEKISFSIETGESLNSISQRLVMNGLLRPEWERFFIFYVKINDSYANFQAGNFMIPKNLTIPEIVETLQNNGTGDEIWIVIPEGLRKDEIAEILDKEFSKTSQESSFDKKEFLELTNNSDFIQNELEFSQITDLEGYLFPAKYLFTSTATARDTIIKMTTTFNQKLSTIGIDKDNPYEYNELIIASMLEREGVNKEDRRMISDIIQRRLREGWLLNIDATLLYYHKDWNHVITVDDKKINHPYNTYQKIGLPPTPICNPGLDAIEAVRDPIQNDYYYYIHDNNGNAHYAKTGQEHEENVQKYLR